MGDVPARDCGRHLNGSALRLELKKAGSGCHGRHFRKRRTCNRGERDAQALAHQRLAPPCSTARFSRTNVVRVTQPFIDGVHQEGMKKKKKGGRGGWAAKRAAGLPTTAPASSRGRLSPAESKLALYRYQGEIVSVVYQ